MRLRLYDMIGEVLSASVPEMTELLGDVPQKLKLVSVDVGGIWIECQILTDKTLAVASRQDASDSPVMFLPFSSIRYLARLYGVPSLSEQALGLKPKKVARPQLSFALSRHLILAWFLLLCKRNNPPLSIFRMNSFTKH